jgi:N6-adenosine-specific RNA methylase IME4
MATPTPVASDKQNSASLVPASLASSAATDASVVMENDAETSAAAPASSSPLLSRNQLAKRAKRAREREKRSAEEIAVVQSDPLCRRLHEVLQAARTLLPSGHFRAAALSTTPAAEEDAAQLEPAIKRARAETAHPVPAVPALAFPVVGCCTVPSNSSRPGSSGSLVRRPPSSVGSSKSSSSGVVLDHALQIQASYTAHALTSEGTFRAYSGNSSSDDKDTGGASRDRMLHDNGDCGCHLFRLDTPYAQLPPKTAAAAIVAAAASGDTGDANTCEDADVVVDSPTQSSQQQAHINPSSCDVEVEHNGVRCVMPPRSTALLSDLSDASALLLRHRPPSGFRLVVADPPWESKSVRRSGRYECFESEHHRRLLSLPVSSLLSATEGCFVAVWVTNNPSLVRFVREELLAAWGAPIHAATWHWLKVCDDGRPVLPLRAEAERNHRKPYEQLIIGFKPPAVVATMPHTAPSSALVAAAAANPTAAGAGPAGRGEGPTPGNGLAHHLPESFPREFTILSVPGVGQHSRKPQLGELLLPFLLSSAAEATDTALTPSKTEQAEPLSMSTAAAAADAVGCGVTTDGLASSPASAHMVPCLELFARNLVAGWTSWGNQCLLFQHMQQQSQQQQPQQEQHD